MPRVVLESAGSALALLERSGQSADEERGEAVASLAWAEAVAGSVERAEQLLAELSSLPLATMCCARTTPATPAQVALMRRGRFVESYGPSIAAAEAIAKAGRPDLAYGCWANAAGAAIAAEEPERALEFLDRGMAAVTGHGLQSIEIHLLAARSFMLRCLGRLEEARAGERVGGALAEQLARPELIAMASTTSA